MKREDLEVVSDLLVKAEECKKELEHLNYVLSDSFVERKSRMHYMNTSELDKTITIPATLQKLIAKILLVHYTTEFSKIDGQIDALLS